MMAVVLLLANFTLFQKKQLLNSGRSVLLKLAPLDPRSIMQGDFMRLRFAMQSALRDQQEQRNHDGQIVVALDKTKSLIL